MMRCLTFMLNGNLREKAGGNFYAARQELREFMSLLCIRRRITAMGRLRIFPQ